MLHVLELEIMNLESALAGAATAIGLWVGLGRLWAAVFPIWRDHRKKVLLRKRVGRGAYDEETIQRSTRYYILPKCCNIDPSQEIELRHALITARESLFPIIDNFLDEHGPFRHLLLLADSGTGKTSCILNYYVHNERRPRKKRHQIALVPLGLPNALKRIEDIPEKEDTVLFLDAFDEDTRAIEDHRARLAELMKAASSFKRVMITCRTQFFPRDEEIPVETGILKVGPRKAGEGPVHEFRKLYLAPFDDADVRMYLRLRYPIWHWKMLQKATNVARSIPLLTARPMLLAHIPDVIERKTTITKPSDLYEVMIAAWLERESAWADKDALRRFAELLAIELYNGRKERESELIAREEVDRLAKEWKIELSPWQRTGRSLLNRDATGNLKFAHRSIMEYLFVTRLLATDPRCIGAVLTDQMKAFLAD